MWRCSSGVSSFERALDLLLDPLLLDRVRDVHVLDAGGAAVGVAQHVQQVAEAHGVGAGQPAGEELTVEVPDREPVGGRVELGVHVRLFGRQRVEVGDEVAPHPVHVDEGVHLHLLLELRVLAPRGVHVGAPLHRLVGHAERVEDVDVEVVLAHEQLVDALEEEARLGTLDDAVVVGGADGEHLRHAEVGQHRLVGGLELDGEVERADTDDGALPGHEPRHRLDRADGARVGEGDGGTGEVVGRELVRADLADEGLVGRPEAAEVERVGLAHDGHHQRARAVGLLDVDREAEVHARVAHDARLAVVALEVGGVHRRHGVGDRTHDGVADEVGEADLAATRATEVAVDDLAVDLEELGGDVAEARGRGDAEAGLHVLHDAGRGATQRLALGLGRRGRGRGDHRRSRGRRRGHHRGRCRSGALGGRGGRADRGDLVDLAPVVGEEVAPARTDRGGVGQVLLVHLVDQPGVGAHGRRHRGFVRHHLGAYRRPPPSPGGGRRPSGLQSRYKTWRPSPDRAKLPRTDGDARVNGRRRP